MHPSEKRLLRMRGDPLACHRERLVTSSLAPGWTGDEVDRAEIQVPRIDVRATDERGGRPILGFCPREETRQRGVWKLHSVRDDSVRPRMEPGEKRHVRW